MIPHSIDWIFHEESEYISTSSQASNLEYIANTLLHSPSVVIVIEPITFMYCNRAYVIVHNGWEEKTVAMSFLHIPSTFTFHIKLSCSCNETSIKHCMYLVTKNGNKLDFELWYNAVLRSVWQDGPGAPQKLGVSPFYLIQSQEHNEARPKHLTFILIDISVNNLIPGHGESQCCRLLSELSTDMIQLIKVMKISCLVGLGLGLKPGPTARPSSKCTLSQNNHGLTCYILVECHTSGSQPEALCFIFIADTHIF